MARVVIPGFRKIETIGEGGTSNYEDLSNKPSINNVVLSGDTSLDMLGIVNYEEGEFSPSLMNTTLSTTSAKGKYIKIGNIVQVFIKFVFSSSTDLSTISGIKDLPFPVNASNATDGFFPTQAQTSNGQYSGLVSYEQYMDSVPSISGITSLLGQQTSKVLRVWGSYEVKED